MIRDTRMSLAFSKFEFDDCNAHTAVREHVARPTTQNYKSTIRYTIIPWVEAERWMSSDGRVRLCSLSSRMYEAKKDGDVIEK